MQFQVRDGELLQAIYENEGVLAKRQIRQRFWNHTSARAMEKRLAILHAANFIDWPDLQQRKYYPIPEPVCWLDWRGAAFVTSAQGVKVEPPQQPTESQLRAFQKSLKEAGIKWMREPRWSLLRHDLAVTDFKMAILEAVRSPEFSIATWLPEGLFRSEPDVISYEYQNVQGGVQKNRRGVIPDAYFEIVVERRRQLGMPARAPFLLELDMATHDNPSFGREKVLPGVHYLKSQEYRARFGSNSGSWLIVTNGGRRRLENLLDQVKTNAGADSEMFFLTTQQMLAQENPLTGPIWFKVNQANTISLLS